MPNEVFIILISLFTLCISFVSVKGTLSNLRHTKKWWKIITKRGWIVLGITILIIGLLLWQNYLTNEKDKMKNLDILELKNHANLILKGRKTDSINNALFQNYLKDTFGLERKGNIANITNIVTFKNVVENISQNSELITQKQDSDNVYFKFENNILYIAPKTGTWANAFYLADTTYLNENSGIRDEGHYSDIVATSLNIDGKMRGYYLTVINDRAVYPNLPVRLNLSEAPNQYIIFGDQGFPTKRWIFKNGKVKWFPEK